MFLMSLLEALKIFKLFKNSPTRGCFDESVHNDVRSQSLMSNSSKYGVGANSLVEKDSNGLALRLS